MKKHNNNRYNFNLSFIDLLFNILITFAALFFLTLILVNKPTQDKKIDAKAEIMIVMTWPDDSADDVDLWVLTPELNKIGFNNKSNTYVTLDHDDLGMTNDYTIDEHGKKHIILLNREVTSIRAWRNGHYVVNVHLYRRYQNPLKNNLIDNNPIPVTVELIQVNPTVKTVYRGTVLLAVEREEKTVFTFDIQNNTIFNITQEQFPFVYKTFGEPERLGVGH